MNSLFQNIQKKNPLPGEKWFGKNLTNIGFQIFLLVLFLSLLFSCKSYRNVDFINPQIPKEERSKTFEPRQIDRIKAEDKLFLTMKNGTSYDIIYSMVENDSIKGLFLQKNNRRLKNPINSGVPYDQIESMKIGKTSAPATIGFSLGVLGLVILLVIDSLNNSFQGGNFSL